MSRPIDVSTELDSIYEEEGRIITLFGQERLVPSRVFFIVAQLCIFSMFTICPWTLIPCTFVLIMVYFYCAMFARLAPSTFFWNTNPGKQDKEPIWQIMFIRPQKKDLQLSQYTLLSFPKLHSKSVTSGKNLPILDVHYRYFFFTKAGQPLKPSSPPLGRIQKTIQEGFPHSTFKKHVFNRILTQTLKLIYNTAECVV